MARPAAARPTQFSTCFKLCSAQALYSQLGDYRGADIFDPQHAGVVPRAVHAIFEAVARSPPSMAFTLKVSAMEIYMERIRDLLAPSQNNLPIRQDDVRGIFVEGVQEEYVASPAEVMGIYAEAVANRAVAATGMNSGSSRSHAVTTITIEARDTQTLDGCRVGKLNIVDLAGSESLRRSEATGQTAAETMTINRSLSALGNVINALTSGGGGGGGGVAPSSGSSVASALGGRRTPASPRETNASPAPMAGDRGEAWERGSVASAATAASRRLRGGAARHIPYRDSKLTRLLQDALGGNARTVLIVCVSPTRINLAESMSTLRFGERAKRIKNKATVNKIRTTEEMQRLLTKAETAIDAQNLLIQALQQQVMVLKSASSPRRRRHSDRSHSTQSTGGSSASDTGNSSGSDSDGDGSSSGSAVSGAAAAAPHSALAGPRRGSTAPGGGAGASDDAAEVVLLRKEVARLRQELKDARSDLRERSVEMQSLSASLAQADSVSTQLRAQLQAARVAAQGGHTGVHSSVRGVRGMERALVADAAAASKEAADARQDAAAAREQVQHLQHLLDRTRAAASTEARKLLDRLQGMRDASATSGWVDEEDDDSTASAVDSTRHSKAIKELQAQLQTVSLATRTISMLGMLLVVFTGQHVSQAATPQVCNGGARLGIKHRCSRLKGCAHSCATSKHSWNW